MTNICSVRICLSTINLFKKGRNLTIVNLSLWDMVKQAEAEQVQNLDGMKNEDDFIPLTTEKRGRSVCLCVCECMCWGILLNKHCALSSLASPVLIFLSDTLYAPYTIFRVCQIFSHNSLSLPALSLFLYVTWTEFT